MPEGLSASEVGKEIADHRAHNAEHGGEDRDRRDRWLSIIEALLLSIVAVLAAYSGYAAAQWGTRSSLALAEASTLRNKASRAETTANVTRTYDEVTFNAWFTAYVAGHQRGQALARDRFRPAYRVAFDAWLATDPLHNPNAPPSPSSMPQYVIPQEHAANVYDAQATAAFARGEHAAATGDDYVRDTVFLATVLFLVGISGHFKIRSARLAVVGVGGALLVFSVVQLLGLPAA